MPALLSFFSLGFVAPVLAQDSQDPSPRPSAPDSAIPQAPPASGKDLRVEKLRRLNEEILARRLQEGPAGDGEAPLDEAVEAARLRLAMVEARLEEKRLHGASLAGPREELTERSRVLARGVAELEEENRTRVAALYRSSKVGAVAAGWQADRARSARLARYLAAIAREQAARLEVLEVEHGGAIAALDRARAEDASVAEDLRVLGVELAEAEASLDRALAGGGYRGYGADATAAAGPYGSPSREAGGAGELPYPERPSHLAYPSDSRFADDHDELAEDRLPAGAADQNLERLADLVAGSEPGAEAGTGDSDETEDADGVDEGEEGDASAGEPVPADTDGVAEDSLAGDDGQDPAADDGENGSEEVSEEASEEASGDGEGDDEDEADSTTSTGEEASRETETNSDSDAGSEEHEVVGEADHSPGEEEATSDDDERRPSSGRRRGLLSRWFGDEAKQERQSDDFAAARGTLSAPVAGKVVANYGQQHKSGATYRGVILRSARGQAVEAVFSGRVSFAGPVPELGNAVIVSHGSRYHTVYARLGDLDVKEGQNIERGARLGTLPDDNADMHFELRDQGRAVDPLPWLGTRLPGAPPE